MCRQNEDVHSLREGFSKKGWMGFYGETAAGKGAAAGVSDTPQVFYVVYAFIYLNQFIRELIEGH